MANANNICIFSWLTVRSWIKSWLIQAHRHKKHEWKDKNCCRKQTRMVWLMRLPTFTAQLHGHVRCLVCGAWNCWCWPDTADNDCGADNNYDNGIATGLPSSTYRIKMKTSMTCCAKWKINYVQVCTARMFSRVCPHSMSLCGPDQFRESILWLGKPQVALAGSRLGDDPVCGLAVSWRWHMPWTGCRRQPQCRWCGDVCRTGAFVELACNARGLASGWSYEQFYVPDVLSMVSSAAS